MIHFLFLFRKYRATVAQISDLNSNEIDGITNHLGRNVDIHQEYYHLHDNAIGLAKVSRLLLADDSGKDEAFNGKRLNEIQMVCLICHCSLLGLDRDFPISFSLKIFPY